MLVHALRAAGLEPSWLVGRPIGGDLRQRRVGRRGEWLVVEADESDRSMLSLQRRDRRAHQRGAGPPRELRLARRAARGVPRVPRGPARRRSSGTGPSCSSCGPGQVDPYDAERADADPRGLALSAGAGSEVRLPVPGAHNAVNAAGALDAARLAGAEAGVRGRGPRRLPRGRAALSAARPQRPRARCSTTTTPTTRPRSPRPSQAARTLEHRRLVAVFQPHLYSRTALLAREFGEALAQADVVARARRLCRARARRGSSRGQRAQRSPRRRRTPPAGGPVYWLPTFADAEPVLAGCCGEGDLCVVMGAGDIDALGTRGWWRRERPGRCPRSCGRDAPLCAGSRRCAPAARRSSSRAPAARRSCSELLAWAQRAAVSRERGRVRLEPADRRRGGRGVSS